MDNQQTTVTENDLAWLAGFLDGEGSLGIYGVKRKDGSLNYGARLQVANTNVHAIENVVRILDGLDIAVRLYQRHFENPNWADAWYTTVNRLAALAKLLPLIIPYLVIKQPHARLMLRFIESRLSYGLNKGGVNSKIPYSDGEQQVIQNLLELNRNHGRLTDYTRSPLIGRIEGEDIVGSESKTSE